MHIDDQRLAGYALGETGLLSDGDRSHLQGCRACRSELTELETITRTARATGELPILVPGPDTLSRITAELAESASGRAPGAPVTAPPEPGRVGAAQASENDGRTTRRPRSLVLVAAGVGLVLGVGGTLAWDRLATTEPEVLATSTLTPLPGHTGGGRAELVRTAAGEALRVEVDTADPGSEYRELWLINTDGRRMISLGVLDGTGRGSYTVPAIPAGDRSGYAIVDVSFEPNDGDATHSLDSVVRGTLT